MNTCSLHPGEELVSYCTECTSAVCCVCAAVHHEGHELRYLYDVLAESRRSLLPALTETENTTTKLVNLIEGVAGKEALLHAYVDAEIDQLKDVVEKKRESLHADAHRRSTDFRQQIQSQLEDCDEDLRVVDEAQAVLKALANGEGLVNNSLSGLLLGRMRFEDFKAAIHKELHVPQVIMSQQQLELPVQNLQLMCEMVDWSAAATATAPQLFP
jgi:hypothetical protein